MQKNAKIASLFVVSTLVSGCIALHPGRESAFSVRGKIVAPEKAPTNCTLEVYLTKGDVKVREVSVSNDFRRTILIVPGVHKYYMVVRCSGNPPYRSATYELGRNFYILNPVDLGTINLGGSVPAETRGEDSLRK